MGHLPALISDLTLILLVAAVTTILFKWIKQPVVLGYIVAGLLVGPSIQLFPTVISPENIETWAEIGVIFLLFGLGLEFSFKKLLKVGSTALITAIIGVGSTFLLGYNIGNILGWDFMDALFLGGILSIASTTIIFRAFEELGLKSQQFTSIVLGVLVIEDLVAVVLMVVLSTVAISRTFEGVEMIYSIGKLGFFLILWFVSGIYFLPTLFRFLRKYLNDETLLIFSLALCFAMVSLAAGAGFSPALGAFIMGSIMAETPKVEKIEHLLSPIKNLFGAIFFVSVGMLLDPHMLVEYALPIMISTLALLLGKPLFVTLGAMLSGQPVKTAVQTGMSLSQIGEFSFIIASLGLQLKVISDFLYPVAVAVSVVTTFTTPYMVNVSGKVSTWINLNVPQRWIQLINKYSLGSQQVKQSSDWQGLVKFYAINTTVFSVLSLSIILLSRKFIYPLFDGQPYQKIVVVGLTLLFLSPILYGLAFRRAHSQAYANVWTKPIYRGPLVGLIITRFLLALFFIGFVFEAYYSSWAAFLGVVITVLILYLLRRRLKQFYGKIETRFLTNLRHGEKEEPVHKELAPWDSHFAQFEIEAQAPVVGIPLINLKLRENFGVNIVMIERGDYVIQIPKPSECIYPGDRISVIGTDEQLLNFKKTIEIPENYKESFKEPDAVLQSFVIPEASLLTGRSIRETKMRELCRAIVVGLERNGERMLNPDPDTSLYANDVVWLVGSQKRIEVYLKNLNET